MSEANLNTATGTDSLFVAPGNDREDRVAKKRDRPGMMSVYPPAEDQATLGGAGSAAYNRAIRCWSHLLARATVDNERTFGRVEWLAIGELLADAHADPALPNAGAMLADYVRRPHAAVERVWQRDAVQKLGQLADKLASLDYVHAWAVVWSVDWRGKAPEGEIDWWTLRSRTAGV